MSQYLVAIDPGIRGCGCACFTDGVLDRCAYVKNPARLGNMAASCITMARAVEAWYDAEADEVAVEWPQVYAQLRDKDPNDLLALCGIDAAVGVCVAPNGRVAAYLPREWKGQLPKSVCASRVRLRLSPAEVCTLSDCGAPPSLMHNVYDAVGIGLYHLGRLAPRRTIAP